MLNLVLSWAVIVAPFALSAIFVLIPAKQDNEALHMRWRWGLLAFGLLFSGVAWWQQDVSAGETKKDRDSAIQETVSKTAESVGKQYQPLLSSLVSKVEGLESQVSAVKNSPVVSGKSALHVLVDNPSSPAPSGAAASAPEIHAASAAAPPNPQYGKHATRFILTTNRVMNGGRATIGCDGKINTGTAIIVGAGATMGGGGMINDHTFNASIDAPNWSPDFPLEIELFHDEDSLGNCRITPR